ncbi:hypothetical protein NCS52_00385200 [Fusarium sp. LHS14.1]|nr:hypothetical protein NCS52_00385200 [Fusarium sp. LHS14.1]
MEAGGTEENASNGVQRMVTVVFSGPENILLPEKTIEKHPELADRFLLARKGKQLDLTSWPAAVVHVLVMFLLTDTYQDLHGLENEELKEYDEHEAMLNRVLQTYLLATEYGLDMLTTLAIRQFSLKSTGMSLRSILDVLCGSSTRYDDDQHFELMDILVQKASRVGWKLESDEGLQTYQLAFKNDGTVFGLFFSQILKQNAEIRDLRLEIQRLTDQLDSEMGEGELA